MLNRRATAFIVASALVLGACGPTAENGNATSGPDKKLSGSATVFAGASLSESFNQLKQEFETQHPEVEIAMNFGSSSGLAAQIAEQGGADVFASADEPNMAKVTSAGLAGPPVIFAGNKLMIITAAGNPLGIRSLADLANPGIKVVLAAPQVPVGRYGREALAKAGVTVNPVSEALDVKGVVGPVTLGEADAGIVYTSDVRAVGAQATGVEIPPELNVDAIYPIAIIKDTPNAEVAQGFIDLVRSARGIEVLTAHGFTAP
ncbi:MAG: molybdate ABC transporter substrate-binding protein [Actinomycetota bacterium]